MTGPRKPRLRFFEQLPSQRHIEEGDRYLYRQEAPRYRFNIIGTGTIGQEHMGVATLLGAGQIHGIFDERRHSMAVASEEHVRRGAEAPIQYDDLSAACQDPDADALFICTPNYTHIDVFEEAAKTGKAIFLEKPMATSLADARRIVEIAADYPSIIQVGLQYRYKAQYVEARHEIFARSSIGNVRTVSMCEYRPPFLDKVEQWNKFNRCSGGTLVEKCCHYFDLMSLIAGAEPARVYASAGQAVNFIDFERNGAASDIDDHAFVIIDYRNGVRGNFTLNMFSPHFFEELVVTGDDGRLIANERFDFLNSGTSGASLSIEKDESAASRNVDVGYATHIEQSGHHGATYFEHVAFVDQLDGKPAGAATPLQGLWSVIIASAAQASASTGEAVDVDDFISDNNLDPVVGR